MIKSAIADQSQKLTENRGEFARVLEADLENVNSLLQGHSEKLVQDRATLSKALEDDLAKLAESRSSIDGLVAGQVEKLAEGRDILKRALEADLQKLAESRSEVDDIIAGHVGKLAEGRNMLTQALEDDLGKARRHAQGSRPLAVGPYRPDRRQEHRYLGGHRRRCREDRAGLQQADRHHRGARRNHGACAFDGCRQCPQRAREERGLRCRRLARKGHGSHQRAA